MLPLEEKHIMWSDLDFPWGLLMVAGDDVLVAGLLSEHERKIRICSEANRRHLEAGEKAEAEKILMENYLASLLSGKEKKIRQAIESGADLMIDQHFGLGLWVRNQLRKAGFKYDDLVLDGVWFSRLMGAVYLSKGEITLPRHLRMKLWKMRFHSFITHTLTKWIAAGTLYAALLTVAFLSVPSYPVAMVPLLLLAIGPPSWIVYVVLDRFFDTCFVRHS
jgi:hypothetical protein